MFGPIENKLDKDPSAHGHTYIYLMYYKVIHFMEN